MGLKKKLILRLRGKSYAMADAIGYSDARSLAKRRFV